MGIAAEGVRSFSSGWRVAAKPCGSCKSSAAALFCRADSAFLCLSCDTRIHCANKVASRHERVWMCEVCEQAPAVVTCKADAATLCVSCDADIHSANPLARRHERVPVEPFFDSAESIIRSASAFNFLVPNETDSHQKEEAEAASWLLPIPNMNSKVMEGGQEMKSEDLFFSEMDSFIDFDYMNPVAHNAGTDSLVPVQSKPVSAPVISHSNENCFDIDFCRSKLNSFSYPTQTLSHSISSSSVDVGVVPDGSSMSDMSYSFGRNVSSNSDPAVPTSATAEQAIQLSGMDREARVLRYREKRKNRKFEKTIRYASRKAYAETRPRIKGRFAKRVEAESEVDRMYGSASVAFATAASQYGVVPTF